MTEPYNYLLKQLKKKIRKDYGYKCKEFEFNCCHCQQYMALEILEINTVLEDK